MIDLLLMGVAAGTLAVTLTRASITRIIRDKLVGKGLISELFDCPYCMSHWTGLIFAIAYGGSFYTVIMNVFIITGLAVGYAALLNKYWHFEDYRVAELKQMLNDAEKALKDLL